MAIPNGQGGIDNPDWNISDTSANKSTLSDLAELAARINSINYFDRKGTVIMQNAFEYGLGGWYVGGLNANCYPILSASHFAVKPYAVKLRCTSDANAYSDLLRRWPLPYLTTQGLEIHYLPTADYDSLAVYYTIYDGGLRYDAWVTLNNTLALIQIVTPGGAWETIDTYNPVVGANEPFSVLKFTFDANNLRWQRLLHNQYNYDITDHEIWTRVSAVPPGVQLSIRLLANSGVATSVWVDNIIMTTNEIRLV